MSVWIMAGSTTGLPFTKTLRTLECFDHERSLRKTAIAEEGATGKFTKGQGGVLEKERAAAGIVEFSLGVALVHIGLHVALRADGYKFAIGDPAEINRRIERLFCRELAGRHRFHVASGRAVTHFATDSRFAKDDMVQSQAPTQCIAQLAGVAYGAIQLVAGGAIEFLPVAG